ncbi:DUF1275 family protein [Pseudomonas sp. RTB3]|nr:DUF1275 family protein [Pseudomonas sp. RTB3]
MLRLLARWSPPLFWVTPWAWSSADWRKRRALPLLLCIAALLSAAAALAIDRSHCQHCWPLLSPWACSTPPSKRSMDFPIGLTYVTGALSRFGQRIRPVDAGRAKKWMASSVDTRGPACLSGAVIGALLEQQMGMRALWVSGALAGVLGLVSLTIPRRWQLSFMPR